MLNFTRANFKKSRGLVSDVCLYRSPEDPQRKEGTELFYAKPRIYCEFTLKK